MWPSKDRLFAIVCTLFTFVQDTQLASHSQLVHLILSVALTIRPAVAVFDAAFLLKRTRAIAANQLECVSRHHLTSGIGRHTAIDHDRLHVFGWWWSPLWNIGKLWRWHLVMLQGMMMTENGGWIAFRVNRQRFQITANIIRHLTVFIALLQHTTAVTMTASTAATISWLI